VEQQISKGLKYTFLVHGILGLIFGLGDLLFPNLLERLYGSPVLDPGLYRVLGAAILAFTASSWLAYMEKAWERVKIVVQMEMVWTILATVVILWLVFMGGRPMVELGNAIVLGGFAAAFSFFYFRR
jgi:hypothetical protein